MLKMFLEDFYLLFIRFCHVPSLPLIVIFLQLMTPEHRKLVNCSEIRSEVDRYNTKTNTNRGNESRYLLLCRQIRPIHHLEECGINHQRQPKIELMFHNVLPSGIMGNQFFAILTSFFGEQYKYT